MGSAFTMCCVTPSLCARSPHFVLPAVAPPPAPDTRARTDENCAPPGTIRAGVRVPPICSAPGVACPDTASYWSHLAPRMLMGVSDRPVLGSHKHWVHTYPPYLRAVREARARLHTLEAETEAWLCHLTVPGGVVFTDSVGQKAGCLGCCLW